MTLIAEHVEPDWFARAHAKSTAAYVMITQDQVGAALPFTL